MFETLKAKGKPEYTSLFDHLSHVVLVAEKIAEHLGMDKDMARKGAILHDIGKASPLFQEKLKEGYRTAPNKMPFRHEIASLFFLPLFPEAEHEDLIDMVIAHHKTIKTREGHSNGIVDLDLRFDEGKVCKHHLSFWEDWSPLALNLLKAFDLPIQELSKEEAEVSYQKVFVYCEQQLSLGFSTWKGLLMGADHFASALIHKTEDKVKRLFKSPDLSAFNRVSELYPLSLKSTDRPAPHTLVTAPTGAGKTDFLMRRCKRRIFYTLPFQASINAMFYRLKEQMKEHNPDLDIRLLHAASRLVVDTGKKEGKEEKVLQGHIGSSVKVLTPHQMASLVFATRGYEAMALDVKGCDVILDEIHTYTNVTRAIVLKIVEILNHLGCRLHIGTATMPTCLYNQVKNLLGAGNVYEVSLTKQELKGFNRHTVHKAASFDACIPLVKKGVTEGEKILLIANQVRKSQERFEWAKRTFPDIPTMLIHSRFKRGNRKELEDKLMAMNESDSPCIVVATQVVEVSLDISFDRMITETAPIDALIQRFGRVNRKRLVKNLGQLKPVHVIAPPETSKDALPYELEVLQRSFEVLPNGKALQETDLQRLIDQVFPRVEDLEIEKAAMFRDGKWRMEKLCHQAKSVLLEMLDIDSVSCITENDRNAYEEAHYDDRMQYEIPILYKTIAFRGLDQSTVGNKPFIVPEAAYSKKIGLQTDQATPENYDNSIQFL